MERLSEPGVSEFQFLTSPLFDGKSSNQCHLPETSDVNGIILYLFCTDPLSTSPQKALEAIGNNLQKQYERWQPRVSYSDTLLLIHVHQQILLVFPFIYFRNLVSF